MLGSDHTADKKSDFTPHETDSTVGVQNVNTGDCQVAYPRDHDEGNPDDEHTPVSTEESASCQLPPFSECYVYLVAFFCGISMMMPLNAVFSAPSYLMNFYKYATHDEDAVAKHTNFWDNVLTYYSLICMITAMIMEPLTLTQRFRRFPITPRLLCGLGILMMEVILLMSVPAGGTSEGGAIATICFAAFISGTGKSIFESTTYGLFGAFPPSYMSTLMGGIGASGVLTSAIQLIVKGALGDGYHNVITQSRIYYSLDVSIHCCTFLFVVSLRWNSYARRRFGGSDAHTHVEDQAGDVEHSSDAHEGHVADGAKTLAGGRQPSDREGDPTAQKAAVVAGEMAHRSNSDGGPTDGPHKDPVSMSSNNNNNNALPGEGDAERCGTGAQNEPVVDGEAPAPAEGATQAKTSNELLMATGIRDTLRKISWMLATCGFNFMVTLLLFPTIVVSADADDYWYGTVAVFLFNVFDVIGRFMPSVAFFRPRTYGQRVYVIIGSFARAVFLPLLLVYSFHLIKGHIYGYLMMVIFGLSNGYVGSLALILGPMSKGITNDGQRFVAGTFMGISILVGGTIGTVISIIIQAVRGS